MGKHFVPAILLALVVSSSFVGSALADPVDVEDGLIFLADGDLTVYEEDATAPSGRTLLATIEIGNATDVVVSGCNAVVTVAPGDPDPQDVVVVDLVSAEVVGEEWCSDGVVDTSQCNATFDPDENELSIPCVDAFGDSFTVKMKRRGNSDNWFVSFIDDNSEDEDGL